MKTEEKISAAIDEAKKELTDEQILFSQIEVEGFLVKPWTIGKLLKINPCVEVILKKLEDRKVDLDVGNISDLIGKIYLSAFSEIVRIVAISVDKKEEELHDLPLAAFIKLIFVIFKQNEESIKNVLSLLQVVGTNART